MIDILFSFQFIGIAILIITLSVALAFLCAQLHKQLLYIALGEWLMDHVYCPLARVLLLMLMAFLLYPMIVVSASYSTLFALFFNHDFLVSMLNILFLSSLAFSFVPVFSHPALAMPVLGCLATAILFMHHQLIPAGLDVSWLPASSASVKLLVLIFVCYLACRWLNELLSEWIDHRFIVTGSKGLVSDINYLIFQMPVVLAYGASLQGQLSLT